jgi:hypothetical protein
LRVYRGTVQLVARALHVEVQLPEVR